MSFLMALADPAELSTLSVVQPRPVSFANVLTYPFCC